MIVEEDPSILTKERVAFAGGILVILITLGPNVGWLDDHRTPVFGDEFRLSYGYVAVGVAFGGSLLCYAMSVAHEQRNLRMQAWGNGAYVISLLIIPASIGTYVLGVMQYALFPNQKLAETIARVLMILLLVVLAIRFRPIVRTLERIDASRRKAVARSTSGGLLTRALDLHRHGFYDMAIVSATNALISAAKGVMPPAKAQGASIMDVYRWILGEKNQEIENLHAKLEEIRKARNLAAHGDLVATSDMAHSIIKSSARIIAVLSDGGEADEESLREI
jgi:predicted S18 family serine protease